MKFSSRKRSIQRRFIYGIGIVVGSIFIIISIGSIIFNSRSLEKELRRDLGNLAQLSVSALSSALWQYNYKYVEDYLSSLFQYQDLVFASVYSDGKLIGKKVRKGIVNADFARFDSSDDFIVKQADILHHGVAIGKIYLAVSRERIDALTVRNSLLAILLLGTIVSAISITILILSGKYLFSPLNRLKSSAEAISNGRLDTKIETGSEDEIGQLARAFDQMIGKLKTTMASRDELEAEITERKRVEAMLRNREQLLNEMGTIAKIGGWEHDLLTRKAIWTEEIYRIIGIESGPIPGPDEHLQYYPPSDRKVLETAYNHAVETGEPFDLELQCRNAEGRLFWARAMGRPEFEKERCVRMKGTFQDITERKQMEENLRQAQKMEAIGTLAGGVAHEFNNVLGIILGNAELALDDVPDWNPAKESLKEVRKASFRAKEVVQQILSFARKTMTPLKPLEINRIVKESLKLMRASIPAMIEIRQNIPSTPKMILGDPTEIHQIVINLCTNASYAMKETGGVLEVAVAEMSLDHKTASRYEDLSAGDFIKLTVKDSGDGIAPDVMEKVFEPYFTTKEFGAGSGMGLAVVYGLVKKCKGAIRIDSRVDKGTTVTVLFPKIEEEAPAEEKEGELPKGNERILLVDDDPAIVNMVRQMLERIGYAVTGMTDSTTAAERFKSAPDDFDLVITDMSMPKMSGDQLAVKLMEVRQDIPVLLCTGHSDTIDEKKAKEMGIKGFAMKPLDMGKLARAVRAVLDKNRDGR